MRLGLWSVCAAGLAACIQLPEQREAPELRFEMPENWVETESTHYQETPWWLELGGEELGVLVEEALIFNHDLSAAAARVEEAVALAKVAGADRLPDLSASLTRNRSRVNFVNLPVPGGGGVLTSTATQVGVSLDLSWELDLWGQLRARHGAALAGIEANAAELLGAQLSLAAQVSKAWFALAEAHLQLQLARETVQVNSDNAELIRDRFERGRGSAVDLHLIENNLALAVALEELWLDARQRAARGLELLLGRYPAGELEALGSLPEVVGSPPAGLPAELLERRPDLLAARARVLAADLRLAESRRALLPNLRLTTSGGRSSSELSDLTDPSFDVWSLFTGLTQPIFQGGRLRAAVDLSGARVRQALADYGTRTLAAMGEVERLLASEEILARRLGSLSSAAESARHARDLVQQRYASGLADVLLLLDAERRVLLSEGQRLNARLAMLDNRIDLHLALGGGFGAAQTEERPMGMDSEISGVEAEEAPMPGELRDERTFESEDSVNSDNRESEDL